jgi:hypothetical protein
MLQTNPLKFWMPKVKKLQKVFAREEKRRKELPLVLKQKISYDIVRRLQELGDNGSLAQQRGIMISATFCYVLGIRHCLYYTYLALMYILSCSSSPTWHPFEQRVKF